MNLLPNSAIQKLPKFEDFDAKFDVTKFSELC